MSNFPERCRQRRRPFPTLDAVQIKKSASVIVLLLLSFTAPAARADPTAQPTKIPTLMPTKTPTRSPTSVPTKAPTTRPTSRPTGKPSPLPTHVPSLRPTEKPSHHPSVHPSSFPSLVPTSKPSPRPSPSPSVLPTNSPSLHPSHHPSFFPTLKPSNQPTERPSPGPTKRPTVAPTQRPSALPTAPPTPVPSVSPTSKPTATPSARPTLIPTETPTNAPTETPSVLPTTSPTAQPSHRPTNRPSQPPSPSPTAMPSKRPSYRPSASPTAPPSSIPTISVKPSMAPTAHPTQKPSVLPSDVPSTQPSSVPTATPIGQPSSSPTLPDQEFDVNLSLEMVLPDVMRGEKIAFEDATDEHIFQSIIGVDFGDAPLQNLQVNAEVLGQERNVEDNTNGGQRIRLLSRRTQEEETITILTLVRVTFKSVDTRSKEDVGLLIGESYNNEDKRQIFINRLISKENSAFFSETKVVEVKVEDSVVPEEQALGAASASASSNTTVFIIVGAAGGGFAALVALGLLAFKRSSGFQSVGTPDDEMILDDGEEGQSQNPNDPKIKVSTEILVERQDDISTLGDPMFGQGMMAGNTERDEQTASVGNDYDYTKQYLRAQGLASLGDSREQLSTRERLNSKDSFEQTRTSSSNSGGFSKMGGPVAPSVFSDDASFEQQFGVEAEHEKRFEVGVPPGKLGMVIDTPNGGVPVVHAIKAESVLAEKVKVGDRLVAVDGDDVTAMTAVQVSKLISLKSDQQRTLAFVRGRETGGTDSATET